MQTRRLTGLMMPALTLLLVMPILAGCARTMASVATTDYGLCDDPRTEEKWDGLLQPIRWSVNDTDETIRQAKANNAQGLELCGSEWGQ